LDDALGDAFKVFSQLVLPDPDDVPVLLLEFGVDADVAGAVPCHLLLPVRGVRARRRVVLRAAPTAD
jgi:hypothetical protein